MPGYDPSHRDDDHPDDLDELDRALQHLERLDNIVNGDYLSRAWLVDDIRLELAAAFEHLLRARAERVPGERGAGGGDRLPDYANAVILNADLTPNDGETVAGQLYYLAVPPVRGLRQHDDDGPAGP
jgi:hypothetical protein